MTQRKGLHGLMAEAGVGVSSPPFSETEVREPIPVDVANRIRRDTRTQILFASPKLDDDLRFRSRLSSRLSKNDADLIRAIHGDIVEAISVDVPHEVEPAPLRRRFDFFERGSAPPSSTRLVQPRSPRRDTATAGVWSFTARSLDLGRGKFPTKAETSGATPNERLLVPSTRLDRLDSERAYDFKKPRVGSVEVDLTPPNVQPMTLREHPPVHQ